PRPSDYKSDALPAELRQPCANFKKLSYRQPNCKRGQNCAARLVPERKTASADPSPVPYCAAACGATGLREPPDTPGNHPQRFLLDARTGNIGRTGENQVTLSRSPMSSTKRAIVVVALSLCGAAAIAGVLIYRWHRPVQSANTGTVPEILNHLPADAPVVAYVDVAALKRLHDSPLATILGLAGENPREDRDYQTFVRDTGFDYTRDLDRAAVAFWPSNLATRQGAADNRTLAIADGRFDQAKIKADALRTGKSITAGGRSLYLVPGNPPVALEFLSTTRIALASGPDAKQVLSRSNSTPRDAAMQERIERVAGAPIFA